MVRRRSPGSGGRWTRRIAIWITLGWGLNVSLADDWPQWMGPQRDNVWRETGIVEKFPEGGPKVLWRSAVATGYSGPSVAAGRVFVTDYVTKDDVRVENFARETSTGIERVLCLDAESGETRWKHEHEVEYSIAYPSGPRTTPTVDAEHVYTLGAHGFLAAFRVADGKLVWSRDLPREFETKVALWGYASHPLVDGDRLLCVVGGKGSHLVAFDKRTGKELWRALTAREQGYSPPTIVEIAGRRQLLALRPDGIGAVDPESGAVLWDLPYDATNGSIIMSPLRWRDHVYAAGYSNKNLLLSVVRGEGEKAETLTAAEVWRDRRNHGLSPVNVQPFLEGDVMYGFDQDGTFHAVELPGGERLWSTARPIAEDRAPTCATAFIVRHEKRFFLACETGELVIAKLGREGYEEIDRTKLLEPTNIAFGRRVVWSAPAFAGRRVFLRNDRELICVDLASP